MTGLYSIHTTMNTIPPSDSSSYPSLQSAWHKMIRRSRASDRAVALQLCRAAFREHNGGCFRALGERSDAEIATALGLTARQVKRLREPSPLWRWEGSDVLLFFVGAPTEEGMPTPASYGKRRARHAAGAGERRLRAARRRRLQQAPAEYPLLDDPESLLAAEEDELGGTDD